MKRTLAWGLPLLSLFLTVLSLDCTLKNCPVNLPNSNAPTATPTCYIYTDSYGSNTLANYDTYDQSWTAATPAALSIQITSGEFQVGSPSTITYSYAIVNNSTFNQSLGDYTVEGDFNLGTVGQGVFGVISRATPASFHAYIFQWNGLNNRWEIEKQIGVGTYYYPGTNSGSPYTLGTWVHLKAVISGNNFNCYETPETSPGVGLGATVTIFNGVSDPGTTAPYTAGGAGIRAYNILGGNILHLDNFSVKTPGCP